MTRASAVQASVDAASRHVAWRDKDLASLLAASVARFPDRTAVVAAGESLTHGELAARAFRVATIFDEAARGAGGAARRCAVMGTRTVHSFAGVCAALFSGAAYVPLNPKFPIARTHWMLEQSDPCALHVDASALDPLIDGLKGHPRPLAIVVPDLDEAGCRSVAASLPTHRVHGRAEVDGSTALPAIPDVDRTLAYLMFTSGSTGVPKGVMVSQRNVVACLASFGDRYGITEADRFSQNFELTFDLSAFDMFLCWLHGASLHVPPPAQQMAPFRFVNESKLTVWFSVPSLARMMSGLRLLKPDSLPSLRWSLFCGEALTRDVATAWGRAASQSVVENLYGPTEATIACTVHRFDPTEPEDPASHGVVPIGSPLPAMRAAVVDEPLNVVPDGGVGELCVAGAQVALGYWRAPALTSERFTPMAWDDEGPGGEREPWYRTGDLVLRDASGCLLYRGRNDDQVKIRGFRVELGEVEFALRRAAGTESAAVIAAPNRTTSVTELVGFVVRGSAPPADLLVAMAGTVPAYMVPVEIVLVGELPVSSNGKIDRSALRRDWEARPVE